jgi:hypothetical protein
MPSGILYFAIGYWEFVEAAELHCKTQKNIRNGQRSLDAPFGLETLKKLVAIAATLLVVSAGTDVPLEGSG